MKRDDLVAEERELRARVASLTRWKDHWQRKADQAVATQRQHEAELAALKVEWSRVRDRLAASKV